MRIVEKLIALEQLSTGSGQPSTGDDQHLLAEVQQLYQEAIAADPAHPQPLILTATDSFLLQGIYQGLSSKELSHRLGVSNYLLNQRRKQLPLEEFSQWLVAQDPHGYGWEYRAGKYFVKFTLS